MGALGRKLQKLTCLDHETGFFLPHEIVFEILCRMPVESLLRCKSVCKLWCATIEDGGFVEEHMRHSKAVYLLLKEKKELNWPIRKDGMAVEKINSTTNKYHIRNPATRHVLDLPDPHHKKFKFTRMFYIRATDNYKLVNVYCQKGTTQGGCEVLTLGTDLTWRTLDIPSLYNLNSRREQLYCQCVNNMFFFIRLCDARIGAASEIVSIEMVNERFVNMKIPQAFSSSWKDVHPFSWENKLCLSNLVNQELHLWLLEDYKKQKWAEKKMVIPLSFLSKYPNITGQLVPQTFRKGWLWFRLCEEHHVAYHITSKRVQIKHPPPGDRLWHTFRYTLVNPSGRSTRRRNKGGAA